MLAEEKPGPLELSRHRFLMLGASIVGVGMLPFAQRNTDGRLASLTTRTGFSLLSP